MEKKKEADGYSYHFSNEELETAKKVVGYGLLGLIAFRILRFLVWK